MEGGAWATFVVCLLWADYWNPACILGIEFWKGLEEVSDAWPISMKLVKVEERDVARGWGIDLEGNSVVFAGISQWKGGERW